MTPDDQQPPPAPKPGAPVGSEPPKAPETPGVKEVKEVKEPPKPQEPPQPPPPGTGDPDRKTIEDSEPVSTATPPPPPKTSAPPSGANGAGPDKTIGEIFLEVSEQTTILIREEIELAKTEVTEKVTRLLRGSVVGLVAGIFLLLALFLIMHGVAILLGQNVFGGRVWLGYLIEAVVFILVAAGGGFYAYRALKKGSPPVPEMAIEQAKEIRATLDSDGGDK